MSNNIQDLNSIQKSAILLISLGVDHASKVFNNLNQTDKEKLTIAIAKLKDITSDVVNDVVKELRYIYKKLFWRNNKNES